MKVAVFGGTGFIGSYIIDELVHAGHHPRVLVRAGSQNKLEEREACTVVVGDVRDEAAVREVCSGASAVIYLIGILRDFPEQAITFKALHFEGARRAIDAAKAAGAERFLLMSANGVRPDGTAYQQTKYRAEQYLRESGLAWTIFRPSVVFGDPRGHMEFATQLARDVIRPLLPAALFYKGMLPIGAGSFSLSPVHVRDVAAAFGRSLDRADTTERIFTLGGPGTLSWKRTLEIIAAACGRQKLFVPVSASVLSMMALAFDRFAFFPITRDQITMLLEGNACAPTDLRDGLGIEPTPFNETTLSYLRRASRFFGRIEFPAVEQSSLGMDLASSHHEGLASFAARKGCCMDRCRAPRNLKFDCRGACQLALLLRLFPSPTRKRQCQRLSQETEMTAVVFMRLPARG